METYRYEGFLSLLAERPFLLPEIEETDPPGIEKEIYEMIEDAVGTETSAIRTLLKPLEKWIEGKVIRTVSGKVLGIYTQRIESDHQSRILLVPENIKKVADRWGVDEETLQAWILTHEGFHALQLDPGYPLREHMRSAAQRVVRGEGGLPELVAAMTWIEGSADWVMDLPGILSRPDIDLLRQKMDIQRSSGGFSLWMRLLRAKRRQYEEGRRLVGDACRELGRESLLLPIENPELLPGPGESSSDWIGRLRKARAS